MSHDFVPNRTEEEIEPSTKKNKTEKLMDGFSSRLEKTDAKFTRKINGIDRRVKKILTYGDDIDDIEERIDDMYERQLQMLSSQSKMSSSLEFIYLFFIMLWSISMMVFFAFVLQLVNNGLLKQAIVDTTFYYSFLPSMTMSIVILYVYQCCTRSESEYNPSQ